MLTIREILDLIGIIRRFYSWIENERIQNPIAGRIQFPKTPPALSESLAIHLLEERRIIENVAFTDIQQGGRIADITARLGNDLKRIEVKASTRGFQYFSESDITAHYLIWIDLFNTLTNDFYIVDIFVLPNPQDYFNRPCKIKLINFLQITGDNTIRYENFNLNEFLTNQNFQ
jgi:hypothetical protein